MGPAHRANRMSRSLPACTWVGSSGFGLAIFAVWALAVEAGCRARLWTFVRARPVAVVVPVLLALTVVGGYARNFYKAAPERREYWQAAGYAPYIDGWFVAYEGSLWRDVLTPREVENFSEKQLFQGFGALGVMAVGGWYAVPSEVSRQRAGVVRGGHGPHALIGRDEVGVRRFTLVRRSFGGPRGERIPGGRPSWRSSSICSASSAGPWAFRRASTSDSRPAAEWIYAGLLTLVVVEQLIPNPDSFLKSQQGYGQAEALVPAMRGADVAYVVYDESMPDYRHHIAAMFAGTWAKVPTINGYSGTRPKDFPAYTYQPSLEELIAVLGPDWSGRLVVIEWGPPIRRRVYRVEKGGRFVLIESS